MPGIAGVITKAPPEQAEAKLHRMLGRLQHESYYRGGIWVNDLLGVYIGWTVRENSFADGMPLFNESKDIVLVFSGEEYPEVGVSGTLKQRGHTLTSQSSAYLVHLYEDNPNFLVTLNGRFHGVLADRSRGTVTLFNDRYGMHRLYYHASPDEFYFSGEAKAILEVCPQLRTLDPKGMGELVTCGCVLENRTLFNGVNLLPPASAWVFQNGTIERKGTYFTPQTWEEQTPLAPEPYYLRVKEVFQRNLPRYFAGPERIGMSLTGGLDTRMIMAWRKPESRTLPCYSFSGMYRNCEDVIIARKVARVCGQTHHVITVGPEFLAHFPRYAERSIYLTDGCINVSHSPDLYVNERAAEIAPVRMTGNYGGEVLRRVIAFKAVDPVPGVFASEFSPYLETSRLNYRRVLATHPLSFAVFRQAPWHHYGLLSLEQTQVTMRSPFLDNDLIRTLFRAPADSCTNTDLSLRLVADGDTALARIRTDRGLLAGDHGFQARAFRRLIAFTVKAEYAFDYGMPHWLALIHNFLAPLHLDRLFLGRHKFYHFRTWYRESLRAYVRSMLLDSRTLSRPFLNPKTVEAVVQGHIKGERNYTLTIHKLLTLELIHRLFIDSH